MLQIVLIYNGLNVLFLFFSLIDIYVMSVHRYTVKRKVGLAPFRHDSINRSPKHIINLMLIEKLTTYIDQFRHLIQDRIHCHNGIYNDQC